MTDMSEVRRALAGNPKKPSRAKLAQAEQPAPGVEAAHDALDGFEVTLYALDDFSSNYAQSPFEVPTITTSIVALTHRLQMQINDVRNVLPAKHSARAELITAGNALDDLDAFSGALENGGMSDHLGGAAMRTFVVSAAQALERAYRACGGYPGSNYLAELGTKRTARRSPNRASA